MNNHAERLRTAIKQLTAEFLARESNRASLITVTDFTLDKRDEHGLIYISVLPEEAEASALKFANRKLHELREFIGERIKVRRVPRLAFEIDKGIKNFNDISEMLIKERKDSLPTGKQVNK